MGCRMTDTNKVKIPLIFKKLKEIFGTLGAVINMSPAFTDFGS